MVDSNTSNLVGSLSSIMMLFAFFPLIQKLTGGWGSGGSNFGKTDGSCTGANCGNGGDPNPGGTAYKNELDPLVQEGKEYWAGMRNMYTDFKENDQRVSMWDLGNPLGPSNAYGALTPTEIAELRKYQNEGVNLYGAESYNTFFPANERVVYYWYGI